MSDDDEDYSLGGGSSSENYVAVPKAATPRRPASSKVSSAVKSKQDTLPFTVEEPLHNSTGSKMTTKTGKGKAVEDIYQRKSQLEHILLRPDTYIGSVESTATPMWVIEDGRMVNRTVSFVPGLYKIFDEILVNAADNKIRDPSMDTIKVTVNKEEGLISVMNNGRGIPVVMHAKEQVYVPELIFGHLLTSSNYDDDEKKVTGGRNGYGAKLCNIFSTEFIVETSDKESGKKFKQVFSNNMSRKTTPKITKAANADFTRITFKPDLSKFGMTEMDNDLIAVLKRRVYDLAGVVPNAKVFLNDERIKIKNFKEYVKLYLDSVYGESGNKPTVVYEKSDERWEVCFAVSDGQFQQVSFVNSICTSKGGTHVNAVADQIAQKLNEIIKKKNKGLPLKPHQIKSHMWLFINCLIENPSFDSQTKENMTLKSTKFGSRCTLSEDFIKKVSKSGVVDNIMAFAKAKQAVQLKQTDGTKRARLSGIAKLDDANNAGTKFGQKCTLILTEGDSAKALAISGLGVVGRDNFGVFPLRGKLLNVREATHKQIMENAEINYIKQILGLKSDKSYTSTESLRYGHVMIMTDQDHDGSHIKGLIINLFDHFWPSLLKAPGFLLQFITPIVRVTKGSHEINFYNIPEYEQWKEANNDGRGWTVKYYKVKPFWNTDSSHTPLTVIEEQGLGTSTSADAKKYFGKMNHHLKPFAKANDDDRQQIELAFSKKRADDRKDWLSNLTSGTFMDHTVDEIPISDFVNKELILYSMADNVRSIPSVVDGFKPGQRKIIYSCFKRNLTKHEIKVAQLAGYVSEHSAYHHGEASLQSTIIGLAQDFVGSNNVNLLEPRGQFGTRLQGGKDHAHARYIFTKLSSVARLIYHPYDDNLLRYQNEENMNIEPEWYVPILPLVLVNGAEGIGTGWSTSIPNYNPRDIVENLRRRLDGEDFSPMHPWYRGFKGAIEQQGDKYKISGTIKKLDSTTLEITELPLGSWTQSYKEFLEALLSGTEKIQPSIKDYKEYHTDTSVHFVISLTEAQMTKAEEEGLEKKFKMATMKSISNMVLFDKGGRLKKYNTIEEIMNEFYELRLEFYQRRKHWLVGRLRRELTKLENQVRFVLEVINGNLVIQNKKRTAVIEQLKARKYAPISKTNEGSMVEHDDEEDTENKETEDLERHDYNYLLSMPIWNLTLEKVQKMTDDRDNKQKELTVLLATSSSDLWKMDLTAFIEEWSHVEIAIVEGAAKNASAVKKAQRKAVSVDTARQSKKRKLFFSTPANVDGDDEGDLDYMDRKVPKTAKSAAPHTTPHMRALRDKEATQGTPRRQPNSNLDASGGKHQEKVPTVALAPDNGTKWKTGTENGGISTEKEELNIKDIKQPAKGAKLKLEEALDPFAFEDFSCRKMIPKSPPVPGKQRKITELFGVPAQSNVKGALESGNQARSIFPGPQWSMI
ncbi:hypothetical protein SpCBS45565_g05063 [Spizellomyces sp. 'palustris']|nr:hypothetical protein SpCBS45565_g05063 [Spizellomyces sp. 'palustris']